MLAADIGGTNIRLAQIRDGLIINEVRHQASFNQLNHLNSKQAELHILHVLQETAETLLTEDTQGLGLGFPGFFIGNSGVLAASPNIPQLKNFALSKALSERLNIPVAAQNDALCAAVGEHSFGAGKGCTNLLHITLGTGIGGGLILNHQPYTGESGMAMEFGHLRIDSANDVRLCGCGNHGCVEAYASAHAISTQYFEVTGRQTSANHIYQAALNGDENAQTILNHAGTYLGQAIAEAVKLLDIRHVSISGGLLGAWDILHPPMLQALNQHLIPPQQGKIIILPSTLDDNAGLLGAATLLA